jgi:hypothetical protein
MSMMLTGTYKTGGVYDVKGRDGSDKQMMSFVVVDSLGNAFPCQMWPDDPQFVDLAPAVDAGELRRRRVHLAIVSYSVRMRQFQDGGVRPWVNFIVSDVGLASSPDAVLAAHFTGTIKAGAVRRGDGSQKPMLWFNAVDEIGTTFPCQMWGDDPQFDDLASLFEQGVRRQSVEFLVACFNLRMRQFPDGKESPQINFTVSDVTLSALARA